MSVRKGEWNHAIAVLGVPGTGKSQYALERALELARTPAYVVAHDPGGRLPRRLQPGGRPSGIVEHRTAAEAAAALAKAPGGVHAIAAADGEQVIALARAVGIASLTREKGAAGVPVVLLLDEAVAVAGMSPHRLGDSLRELIATRRHEHVAIVWTSQSPRLAHYALLGLSTEIVLFRLPDNRALQRLEEVGVPATTLADVRTLPNYRYRLHKM